MFFLLWLNCLIVFGQKDEPINTDRPDQSEGTYILPKRNLQLENGITTLNNVFINNFMFRYGINKSTEIRLVADFGVADNQKGLFPLGISMKKRLIKQNKFAPEITLVGYYRNDKIASKGFSENSDSYSVLLAFQNNITDRFGIGYNIGTTNFGKVVNITTSFGYSVTNRINCFVEYFSHFEKQNPAQHNFDLGILYQLKYNLQIDVAFGRSLTKSNTLLYLTTGVAYRFKKNNNSKRNILTNLPKNQGEGRINMPLTW